MNPFQVYLYMYWDVMNLTIFAQLIYTNKNWQKKSRQRQP
jgi:membrane protein insertase Oxa1/YidC/SpoIIIJ